MFCPVKPTYFCVPNGMPTFWSPLNPNRPAADSGAGKQQVRRLYCRDDRLPVVDRLLPDSHCLAGMGDSRKTGSDDGS